MQTLIVLLTLCAGFCTAGPFVEVKNSPVFRTVVTTRNVTGLSIDEDKGKVPGRNRIGSYIDVHVVDKPHNLFIGRCLRDQRELHRENIILNNDGKSHVTAVIRINVDGPIDITCVKVHDQQPGSGAYPSYLAGGVGHNFVEISVSTRYGMGFHFFIQIFGNTDKKPKAPPSGRS